jgi:hypothetical protein
MQWRMIAAELTCLDLDLRNMQSKGRMLEDNVNISWSAQFSSWVLAK